MVIAVNLSVAAAALSRKHGAFSAAIVRERFAGEVR
jgi:hypothetical protein